MPSDLDDILGDLSALEHQLDVEQSEVTHTLKRRPPRAATVTSQPSPRRLAMTSALASASSDIPSSPRITGVQGHNAKVNGSVSNGERNHMLTNGCSSPSVQSKRQRSIATNGECTTSSQAAWASNIDAQLQHALSELSSIVASPQHVPKLRHHQQQDQHSPTSVGRLQSQNSCTGVVTSNNTNSPIRRCLKPQQRVPAEWSTTNNSVNNNNNNTGYCNDTAADERAGKAEMMQRFIEVSLNNQQHSQQQQQQLGTNSPETDSAFCSDNISLPSSGSRASVMTNSSQGSGRDHVDKGKDATLKTPVKVSQLVSIYRLLEQCRIK